MNEETDLWETRNCYCLAARREARAITRLYEEKLRPFGLRATQFSILAALTLKGPTRLGELADLLGLERTTLTRAAKRLERYGWIGAASSMDAREHRLKVLPAGRRKLKAAVPAWKEVQDRLEQNYAAGPKSLAQRTANFTPDRKLKETRP